MNHEELRAIFAGVAFIALLVLGFYLVAIVWDRYHSREQRESEEFFKDRWN